MRTGRPPKPTTLKRLAGNPGGRKLNQSEPDFTGKEMKCPDFLTKLAKAEWRRIVAELAAVDLLRDAHSASLAAYCQSYARWCSAEEIVEAEGQILKIPIFDKQRKVVGYRSVRHPATLIAKDEKLAMQRFAGLFGFDPSSSTRVSAPAKRVDPNDPWKQFSAEFGLEAAKQ